MWDAAFVVDVQIGLKAQVWVDVGHHITIRGGLNRQGETFEVPWVLR